MQRRLKILIAGIKVVVRINDIIMRTIEKVKMTNNRLKPKNTNIKMIDVMIAITIDE